MNKNQRCLITYEPNSQGLYSRKALKQLDRRLESLLPFPYSALAQRQEAAQRADKISIQGVQPKISAKLSVSDSTFTIVDRKGKFIIKPQNELYPFLPENEDVTMKMAKVVSIETPQHGLLYCEDGSLSYFIKRFDRYGHHQKYALEDFAQLASRSRDTKYDYSMEKLIPIIEKYCTFPLKEKLHLFKLTLFSLLTGNEDMHLKNFSLIRKDGQIRFSPAYDLVNTTLAIPQTKEELALPLNGKKRNITRRMLIDYFAKERLQLSEKSILGELDRFKSARSAWFKLIDHSFLPEEYKKKYKEIMNSRCERFLD